MKTLIAVSLMFISVGAWSSTQSVVPKAISEASGSTIYEKIENLYETGVVADLEALDGKVKSGRCFTADSQDTPLPAYATVTMHVEDVGPISDPIKTFGVLGQLNTTEKPNFYDSKSVTDVPTGRAKALLSKDKKSFVATYETYEKVYFRDSGAYTIMLATNSAQVLTTACYLYSIH
jgi:hypothetical protein